MIHFPVQRPGDRHAGQLDFHRAAALPGRRDGLGHDHSVDRCHWIRSVISLSSQSQCERVFKMELTGLLSNITCRNFPLPHGVLEPAGGAGRRRRRH